MNSKPPYFADKKVLITGASSGVGMALAYWYVYSSIIFSSVNLSLTNQFYFRYLNNGAQVALVGRDIETLSKIGE